MAIKIERGGKILIFLLGVGLIGFAANKYGWIDFSKWFGSKGSAPASDVKVDTTKPLPATASGETNNVRVRVNISVGWLGGLVPDGGLGPRPEPASHRK